MKKFSDASNEAAGTGMSRNGEVVPNTHPCSGWRKATPELAAAERHAQAGEQADVPKARAFVAVKRVAAHIGLKAGDVLLLDTLGAFTQTQDWEQGRSPIVWPSNAYLMLQTGFSLSALKRHARRLAEIGLIAFKDSPNGKRWGHRDAAGHILEAYGFDLSPLAARAEEFGQLYAALQAERDLCQRLKRQITVARRIIRARIDAAQINSLDGPWAQLTKTFESLMSHFPRRNVDSVRLAQLLDLFSDLQERVEAAYLNTLHTKKPVENIDEAKDQLVEETHEMNPSGANTDPHIQTTNQLNIEISKPAQTQQTTDLVCDETQNKAGRRKTKRRERSESQEQGHKLNLRTVVQACPEFTSWAHNLGGFARDWGDLHRAAGLLRTMIGVSEKIWNHAQSSLGTHVATAAFALTFDKHCAGEVTSPGGYLRGIIRKAGAGELHLERSFYGRLDRAAA